MKIEDDYLEHIKECWGFAQEVANDLVNQELKGIHMALIISIFEKVCSPYHYFLGNEEHEPPPAQPSTEKQILYAKQLGIQDPEKMSKQQLSEGIDKAVKSGKK
jgi:hypothetical protein